MKILVLSQYFWPENFKINELAIELNKKHNVEILTSIPNYPSGKIYKDFSKSKKKFSNYKGIKIYRSWQFLRGDGNKLRLILNYISFIISSIFFGLSLKKKYDVVFVFLPSPILTAISGIILSKIFKCKISLWVLDLWPEVLADLKIINSKYILKVLDKIINYMYQKSDLIFVQSKSFEKIIRKKTKNKKIYVLNSWSDKILFKSDKYIKKTNSILYLGNIGYSQNFENLIEATKILATRKINFQITIIGSGRKASWLSEKIDNEQLNKFIKIEKFKKNHLLGKYIKSTDFCFLSLRKGKGLNSTIPAKLQTYMQCSKPIIAVSDGEVKNIIEKAKCGFTSKPKDSQELANNIHKAFKLDNKTKKKYGNNAKKYALKNFDKKKILKQFNKIFDQINK